MVIDSCVFIDHLRAKDKANTKLYNLSADSDCFVTAVTIYELLIGATTVEKEQEVHIVTEGFQVLPFTVTASAKAAEVYHQLKNKHQLIDFRDIFIAATCIANNQPLFTKNVKHFERIEDLTLYKI